MHLLSLEKPINDVPVRAKLNLSLEALRGFAALVVVWHHIIYLGPMLDPQYQPTGVLSFSPPGHVAVLVFFLLSGYVIEVSTKPISNWRDVKLYLRKRLFRIYPIYFLALLLTLAVGGLTAGWPTIVAHFTLTQVAFSHLLNENMALWSLHYEVLFYLLYIPLRYFRLSAVWVTVASLMLGLAAILLGYMPLLSSYLIGFTFWLTGVIIARWSTHATANIPSTRRQLAALLLLFSAAYFNLFAPALARVVTQANGLLSYPSTTPWEQRMMSVEDFAFLPLCLFILLLFIGKDYPMRRWIAAALLFSPLYTFRHVAQIANSSDAAVWVIPSLAYGLGVGLYYLPAISESVAHRVTKGLVWVGSISYGLYIVHIPLMAIMSFINSFSGSLITWVVRGIGYVALSLAAAYFLDKVCQPRIKNILDKHS
jgi:peptidoglycan/LPS O-acetylase OafA/YrhL